jgi:mycothiol synthase
MNIASFSENALEQIVTLWNDSSPFQQCALAVIREKIFEDQGVPPKLRLAATVNSQVVGFCVGAVRPDTRRGHIKLIAVDPSLRRQGIGSALLEAVESALMAQAIQTIRVDEAAPNYLAPGVDQRNDEAYGFFQSHAYDVIGEAKNLSVTLVGQDFDTIEALQVGGMRMRRAIGNDWPSINELLAAHWPAWNGEISRAFQNDPISVHIAKRNRKVIGFSAYDANNVGTGWFGPMGTDPAARGQGIGRVLLLRCLNDMQSQGPDQATIPWVGPVEFYERHCGAVPSERFWRLEKRL